jgi:hypothetical protein
MLRSLEMRTATAAYPLGIKSMRARGILSDINSRYDGFFLIFLFTIALIN